MAIDKEELKELLSEHLTITIRTKENRGYYGESGSLEIITTVSFDNEEICTDTDYISLPLGN